MVAAGVARAGAFAARPLREGEASGLNSRPAALRRAAGGGAGVTEGEGRAGTSRARPGDPAALGESFEAHRPDVARLCRRILSDETAAEDAVAETFLRARERLESYDAASGPRPWLLAIAAHHCIDLLRRRSTEARLFDDGGIDAADLADRGPSPLQRLVRAEERAALLAAIDALPPKYRLPLVLRHFAELDYERIAALLDVSRGQVGTLLLRARRRLRADLGGGER
jgi:RNA polymerase sigma-70 factor (ECF subfamily)